MVSLFSGLRRTRTGLALALTPSEKSEVFADLEERLLLADTGTKAASHIVKLTREKAGKDPDIVTVGQAIRDSIGELLQRLHVEPVVWHTVPHVILMVGTNGGGKTTTVAKLARQAAMAGKSVILAAADTFRAAAVEQLQALGARLDGDVRVIAGDKDPGATAYNAVAAGCAAQTDLVIIDTAGRQPTSKSLMAEARKINNAIGKALPGAPHEKILAIDANTGQNALQQVMSFDSDIGLTGCVLTKLDGTACGGVILAIASERALPVHYVGVGEGVDDLVPFDSAEFLSALFTAES